MPESFEQSTSEKRRSMPLAKSVSLLKIPEAEETSPLGNVLPFLILIMSLEGIDNALFPNVGKALERTIGFDVGFLGNFSTVELFTKASFGPIWGVICARGHMKRTNILTLCTFLQGAATLCMCFLFDYPYALLFMRCFNGISLSGLTPIAFSVVADRFDDSIRGRMFALMNMSKGLGGTIMGAYYSYSSEWCFSDPVRFDQCELPSDDCDGPTPAPCTCGGILGWQFSFVATGVLIMIFAPFVCFFMKVPPVTVLDRPETTGGGNKCVAEIQGLLGLFKKPTFAILVIQGCFGSIPWQAFQFRGFFFETAGVTKGEVTTILTVIGFVGIFGGAFSGWLGDFLNNKWPYHGRVLNAEFSVYGGIPFAGLTFANFATPSEENAFVHYFTLSVLLHLICGGVQGGTNAPILSALAEPDERALVISWQTSLESAISSFGPIIFTSLNAYFGYDKDCNVKCDRPDNCGTVDQNREAAGTALLLTSTVPWGICGLLYTTLHYFLPRDMERLWVQRQLDLTRRSDASALNTELVS